MASNTTKTTYKTPSMREDLMEGWYSVEPEETAALTLIGTAEAATASYKEWTTGELRAPRKNAQIEGADSITEGEPVGGARVGNYTQILADQATVSTTAEMIKDAAKLASAKRQVYEKTKEVKRDQEFAILQNTVAVPGDRTTARELAGFPAWIRSNADRGAGGADPEMSGGASGSGHPNVAPVDGTLRAFTEDLLKSVMVQRWRASGTRDGALLMGGEAKGKFSGFAGRAEAETRAETKTNWATVDVYVSDFGKLKAIPSLHQRERDVFILTADQAGASYLTTPRQRPLADGALNKKRVIEAEMTLVVHNERAHAAIYDIDASL